MSANNWAICPKCLAGARAFEQQARANVAALYGTVSVAEFDAAREAVQAVDPEKFQTFREDYEFYGAETGELIATYSGSCTECGLSCNLNVGKRFWPARSEEGLS